MKQLLVAAFFTFALATPAFAQMEGLEQRVTALEPVVISLQAEVDALQAEVYALRAYVNINTSNIQINSSDIFDLEGNVADLWVVYAALDERVATLEDISHVKMIDLIAPSVSASAEGLVAGDYVLARDCEDRFNNAVSWCVGEVKSGGHTVHVFSWFAGAGSPIPLARSITMAP